MVLIIFKPNHYVKQDRRKQARDYPDPQRSGKQEAGVGWVAQISFQSREAATFIFYIQGRFREVISGVILEF